MIYEQAMALKKGDKVHYQHGSDHLEARVFAIAPVRWRRELTVSIVVPIRRLHLTVKTEELDRLHAIEECAPVHPEQPAFETAGLFD